ncbi:MAG: hypothetical protein Q9171_001528 [Xanthocarpia ochracea]
MSSPDDHTGGESCKDRSHTLGGGRRYPDRDSLGPERSQVNVNPSKSLYPLFDQSHILMSYTGHLPPQARQPLSHSMILGTIPSQDQQTSGVQQPPRGDPILFDEVTREEQEELDDLRTHRDQAAEALGKQKRVVERAQRRLEDAEERIRERQQQSRAFRPSSSSQTNQQLPQPTSVNAATYWNTTPSTGKRNADEFETDKDEDGSHQNGRQVKRRFDLQRTEEAQSQSIRRTGKDLKASLGTRRHLHPSTFIRPTGPSNTLYRAPYSYGQYLLQTPDGTGPSQAPSIKLDAVPEIQSEPQGSGFSEKDAEVEDWLAPGKPTNDQTLGPQQAVYGDYGQVNNQWLDDSTKKVHQAYDSNASQFPEVQPNLPNANPSAQPAWDPYSNPHDPGYIPSSLSTATPAQRQEKFRRGPYRTDTRTGKRQRSDSNATEGSASQTGAGSQIGEGNGQKPPTKRQTKRQKLLAGGKVIPKDSEKVMGEVKRDDDGNLLHLFHGKWVPAAYHHERRPALLAREASKGAYTYPPTQGMTGDDKTAFHPDYAHLDMSVRDGRPHLLYQWNPPEEEMPYQDPGLMYDPADGRLLLDLNNHPILNWPELPMTISGQVDGSWLEYWWRLNRNIRLEDMVARCPKRTQRSGTSSYRDLPGTSAFGNRRERDRLIIGTRSWEQKEGSKEIKTQYERIMPNRVLAEIAHNNTTTWFRDLTNKEVNAMCYTNRGQGTALSRAGNRKLPEEKKKTVDGKRDSDLEAIFTRLLEEKRDAGAQDPVYAQVGGANPGTAFADPAAGRAFAGAATVNAGGPSINSQAPGPDGDVDDDNAPFDPLFNEGDTTLVEDGNAIPPKHSPTKLENLGQQNVHPGGVQEPNSQRGAINNDPPRRVQGFAWSVPTTREEMDSISGALESARKLCRSWAKQEPPPTAANSSYMAQFYDLEEWLRSRWTVMRPGQIPPVLHARPDWQGSWDCWMAQDLDLFDIQQFGPRPDEALTGDELTLDNPQTAKNEQSDNEQHAFGHGTTLEDDPGIQQSVDFLDPNQIHILNDFNNNSPAAVTERPSLSASTGAPPGYAEATSMPSIKEAAADWWKESQDQQPDALSGLQSQAAGDAMLPNGQDGPVGFNDDLLDYDVFFNELATQEQGGTHNDTVDGKEIEFGDGY